MTVGLAWWLGAVLLAAAVGKLRGLELTRRSIGRLVADRVGRGWLTAAATGVVGVESSVGAALLAGWPTRLAAAGGACGLFAVFVLVVRRARRLGMACGCFGGFSVRAVGSREQARAWALAGTAALLLALEATGRDPWRAAGAAALGVAALGCGVGALTVVVAVVRAPPRQSARGWARTLRRRRAGWRPAGPVRRGRVLRAVRQDPDVRLLVARAGSAPDWRRATVRVLVGGAGLTQLTATGAGLVWQVLSRPGAPLAVICFTPSGPLVPHRDQSCDAARR
jgi:uncharacterized membrane protein YphA (DoxX/SURF4 family)